MLKKTHKTRANKDTLLMQEREEVFSGDNHEMSAFHEGEKAQNAMQNEVSALMSQLEELDNHLKLVSPSNSVDIDSMNQNDLKDQMASIKKWMEGVRRKMAEINGFLKQWQRESSGYFRAEEKNEKFDEINFFDDPDQFDANAETAPTLLQDPNGWKSFGKSSPNPEMSELTAVKEKNTKLMPEDHDSDIELTDGEKPLAVVDDLVEEKPSSNEQDEEVYYEVEDEFLVRDNNISGENINEEGQRQEGENDDFFYQLDQWQEGKEDDYQLSRRGWYGGIVVPDYYDALTDEEKLKCMENLLKNEGTDSSSMSFIAPQRSLPSAEERIRLLEEELEGANFLIDELKRQLYQANEDYRSNLRKKSATLIAWQNAYEELEKKYERLKNGHSRKMDEQEEREGL